jgi:L-2,4-diaminobutyric acid acetyltransferase
MLEEKANVKIKLRNLKVEDIKEVYKLLTANRPYVGLNSRYTYFLLAKDFADTCIVAEHNGKIVAFSSGYVPRARPDIFFNWETVVHEAYRGHGIQRSMLLHQIKMTNAKYFEGTVNPSNAVSKKNFLQIAELLDTKWEEKVLFSEEDFENDGHEAEVLYRIGPISTDALKRQLAAFASH